ncbi:ASKHA domain-containing protein [Vallitalea okinawensis]|uniref:ASKHA domain-containing protein n=1 Tax=Vallitalea okinawensis TaxID=2078660 RepID=UPI000CFA87A9|nr:ASKHA domain-containing protein [Vallitalea okinawensis]
MSILRNIIVKPNKERTLNAMECYVDSSIYHEVSNRYDEILPQVMKAIEPIIAYQLNENNNKERLGNIFNYCTSLVSIVVTLGHKVCELSSEAMENDHYLEGFMIDAILDDLTFSLENKAYETIKLDFEKRGLHLTRRLYPGDGEIPLEYQEILLKEVDPQQQLNMCVTTGFMLNPAKALSFVCGVNEEILPSDIDSGHNCIECQHAMKCKWRNKSIELTVIDDKNHYKIPVYCHTNLLDILSENNILIPSPCGGNGTCGKCTIKLIKGRLTPSDIDLTFFTQNQIKEGYRLACGAVIEESCTVELINPYDQMDVLEDYDRELILPKVLRESSDSREDKSNLGIAIDIGTTTIAIQLIYLKTGEILNSYSCLNSQSKYGADVISRIQNANSGYLTELSVLIKKDILKGIEELLQNEESEKVRHITIVGNTTMFHLLLGLSCDTLGIFPFEPVTVELMEYDFQQLLGTNLLHCDVTLLPGISTFVGADIISGIYYSDLNKQESISLFIDIGTNGEMAIGNHHKIIASATAAGPAFEGGNISSGVGSVPGAIRNIKYTHPYFNFGTIADDPPIGLCGSGILDFMAEGLNHGWIDSTGALQAPFDGDEVCIGGDTITVTQKDIREIQLAKAAIRAGIESLIKEYECCYDDIQHVFLAGGFGVNLNVDSAVKIGLIPKALQNRIKSIGNSALGGAVKYLLDHKGKENTLKIVSHTRSIVLSDIHGFNELFMEQMFFDQE